MCLGNFVASIDLTIVTVALPTLSRNLNADNGELQWIVDAYALTTAGLLLSAGNLGDRYGRRGWLTIGLAIFAATSAVAATATSPGTLIAARAAMGLGAAIIYPTTLALITNIFPAPAQRAKAIGVWSAMTGLGVIAGPITGGWLLGHFSLGSIFWVNVPIAGLALVGALLFVPTSKDPERVPIDFAGLALSAIGITLLTYTIIEAPEIGWSGARTCAGFIAAAILLAAFIWQELHTAHPMLDLSIFADRRFTGGTIAIAAAALAMCGFVFVATQYLQFVTAYTPLQTGVRLLPLAFSVAAASVLAPRFAERFGATVAVTGGLGALAVAIAWSGYFDSATSYWAIAAAMTLLGAGLGLTLAAATDAIMGSLGQATLGVGAAVTGATRQLGGAFGVAIVGSVFASVYTHNLDRSSAVQETMPRTHDSMRESMAQAQGVLAHLPSAQSQNIHQAVEAAFLDGVRVSCLVCAGFAVAAAIAVAIVLPARGSPRTQDPAIRISTR
ncbi:MFS transporter [Mycobacterium szulgai]|nr:MFS transporter [Mycobacterium szulgai]